MKAEVGCAAVSAKYMNQSHQASDWPTYLQLTHQTKIEQPMESYYALIDGMISNTTTYPDIPKQSGQSEIPAPRAQALKYCD